MAASTRCLELPSPGSFLTRSFQKAETQARHHGLGPLSMGEAAGASQGNPSPPPISTGPVISDPQSWPWSLEAGRQACILHVEERPGGKRLTEGRLCLTFHIVLPGLPWGPAPSQPWCQALGCGRCALRGRRQVAPLFFPLPRSPSVPGPWRGDPEEGAAWPTADVTWTPCGLRGVPQHNCTDHGRKAFLQMCSR